MESAEREMEAWCRAESEAKHKKHQKKLALVKEKKALHDTSGLHIVRVLILVEKGRWKEHSSYLVKASSCAEAENKIRVLNVAETKFGEPLFRENNSIMVEPVEFEHDGIMQI